MRRVLLVDDNQAFAENVAEILADAGMEAEVAAGGQAALERMTRARYDVLISDMRMPAMGGAELVHRVRRLDPGIPALVITAYTNDDDLKAARREGLLAILPKPAPFARLLDLVRTARRDGLVAIVEDDVALADNLSEALRARGFAAVTATSVLETERLAHLRPFAALVDLRLPGGEDGLALRRLRARFPGLPILVMTGHDDVTPPEAPLRLFKKPFRTDEVLEAVERLYAPPG